MSHSDLPRSSCLPSRRDALRGLALLGGVAAASSASPVIGQEIPSVVTKGRLNQSLCRWCYGKIELDDLCQAAAKMGLVGIDLMSPADFPTLKKYGLVCTMTSSHSLGKGLNNPAYHDRCLEQINQAIEATAAEGWSNVICFSGNAQGIDRKAGLKHCAEALKKVTPVAEQKGVVIQMELLNSKVNHKGYMADTTEWGFELVKQVGSDHFKILYDVYHMQIMEGDIIRTIQDHHDMIGHYHTGGNPGRHEIDDSQELNYAAIARAIAETGFRGYFAHEFIPVGDPLTSLAEAVALCDV